MRVMVLVLGLAQLQLLENHQVVHSEGLGLLLGRVGLRRLGWGCLLLWLKLLPPPLPLPLQDPASEQDQAQPRALYRPQPRIRPKARTKATTISRFEIKTSPPTAHPIQPPSAAQPGRSSTPPLLTILSIQHQNTNAISPICSLRSRSSTRVDHAPRISRRMWRSTRRM